MPNQEVEVRQLESTALAWPDRAKAIVIVDQPSYDTATTLVIQIADLKKRIIDHHRPIKEAANAAHKVAVAAEKKLLDPLQQADFILRVGIGTWEREQERIRQEAQRKLEEAQRKADEEARIALAVEAETGGAEEETVAEILDTPVVLPAVIAAPTFQRTQGVSTQQRWSAEVVDIKALCRAVADGKASTEYVQANLVALNGLARAMRQTMNIPGVRAVPETTVAVRRTI